jgi:hypothetical protein
MRIRSLCIALLLVAGSPAAKADDEFARLLLPVFTQPIAGAFGSEFRIEFRATLAHGDSADIYGLAQVAGSPRRLTTAAPELSGVIPNGAPGRYIYVPREQLGRVAMHLRAYDTSRSAANFGTEIPIVREEDFVGSEAALITLAGIPTDPRFRNTVRIYGSDDRDLTVYIRGAGLATQRNITVRAGATEFEPAYAEFSDFPAGVGPLDVQIQPTTITFSPPNPYAMWAFISVTNNETQHITTITPQP